MSADYTIDPTRRLLVVHLYGRVTRADAVFIRTQVTSDPAFDQGFSDLIDLTGATSIELTTEDLQHFGGEPLTARGVRYAMVAPTPLAYGIARMFRAYREPHGVLVEIFHDRASAERWLETGEREGGARAR
jgi:hypothetical protein